MLLVWANEAAKREERAVHVYVRNKADRSHRWDAGKNLEPFNSFPPLELEHHRQGPHWFCYHRMEFDECGCVDEVVNKQNMGGRAGEGQGRHHRSGNTL